MGPQTADLRQPGDYTVSEEKQPAIDYFDDLPPVEAEPATLQLLARLANESKQLEAEINAESVALEEKNARQAKLLRVRIPEIMKTLGMEEFKLTDGSKIGIKADVKCGITEANKPAAFEWLEANEFDGIIKTNVGVDFGKGEIEDARKAVEALEAIGAHPTMARNVHPATLKSFVKERLEKGDNIPIDTFSIFEFTVAKITLPKAAKPK